MTASHAISASLPVTRRTLVADRGHGYVFWYRNARMWGKPMLWSVRYAREARLRFN